jgi:hypothetical protein
MRRVILMLTEAQAAWLRGAVRTHREDMGLADMLSKADERHVEDILKQLRAPAKEAQLLVKEKEKSDAHRTG